MRRKRLIERPVYFGALVMLTSVVIGVVWGKTWEQQAMNVVLGFTAGALCSGLVLLAERVWRRRDRTG